jgi:hypothetical protein
MKQFKEIMEQAAAGKLDDKAVADKLDSEILGPWRAATAKFEREGSEEKMLEYLRTREASFELFVKATRDNDEKAVAKAVEKFKEADTLIQAINARQ